MSAAEQVVRPAKASASDGAGGYRVIDAWEVWCPGCEDSHVMGTHTFDGDLERPTFDPSILVMYGTVAGVEKRCHSFLRAGVWEFLGDSTHALAGQRVPVVPIPREALS